MLTAGDFGRLPTGTVASTDTVIYYSSGVLYRTTVANLLANGVGLDSTELGFLDGTVAGTVAASKAMVVDSSRDIGATSTATAVRNFYCTSALAGRSGTAGTIQVFPTTASKGKVTFTTSDNSGDTTTNINIAAQAGARTLTVVDCGQSTANFLFSEGAQTVNGAQTFTSTLAVTGALTSATDKTDYQQFVGIESADFANTVGTWTRTRIAEADYVLRHTAAADTSVLALEIDPIIRTTASKGFKLTSIDVIYKITTLALTAHTATLDLVNYANNAARTITSVPLTGSLSTATQTNEYVTNLAVTTPAFDVTTASVYRFELTVNAQATSAYDFVGINLKFTRNDL